jgi:methionine-rich copper-binding protein CopC
MQSPTRSRRRLVGLALGVLLGVLVLPWSPAAAHTDLIGSNPAAGASLRQPPARLTLTFNEPMDPRLAVVALTVGKREPARIDVAAGVDAMELVATVPDGMAHGGRWRVEFRVTSADGHPVQGDLAFSVELRTDVTADEPRAATPTDPSPGPGPSTSDESGPGPAVIAGVVGGGVLLVALLFLVARYLRVEES